MPRFLRYLRIAFSATCLIACTWLIVRYANGLEHPDYDWIRPLGKYAFETTSNNGHFTFRIVNTSGGLASVRPWRFSTFDRPPTQTLVGDETRPSFRIKLDGATVVADCPAYVPVLFVISLAAVPWLPVRFSLRTLLIATTLTAVVLGLMVWSAS